MDNNHYQELQENLKLIQIKSRSKSWCKCNFKKEKMYEFLDRLSSIALQELETLKEFQEKHLIIRGNYTLGIKEQIVFPEIEIDKVDKVLGLGVTIVTSAKTDTKKEEHY